MSELSEVGAVLRGDADVAVVRVAERQGLRSVPAGELVVRTGDAAAGRLLGGAADAVVAALVADVLAGGGLRSVQVPLGEADAGAAGLASGGTATLTAHPLSAGAAGLLGAALAGGEPALLAASATGVLVLAGPQLERRAATLGADGDAAVDEHARQLLRRGVSATVTLGEGADGVLLDLWVPVPRVLVVGAGALGAALSAQTQVLGWRYEQLHEVVETEAAVGTMIAADVLVLLDHAPAFDAALLACARGPGFAGALGSRDTQSARRERLRAAGATVDDLAQVRGPVGLDLGARTPAETAVSIVAEVLARRGGRTPVALGSTEARISP